MKITNIVSASILIREYEELEKFIDMLKTSNTNALRVYNCVNTHQYVVDAELHDILIKYYENKLLGIKNIIEEL